MGVRRVAVVVVAALVVTAAIASAAALGGSSAARAKNTAKLKIGLPGPDKIKVSVVTVKVKAPKGKRARPPKVVAKNAKQLGSAQVNSQVVVTVSPKSSRKRAATFNVGVFIHQYQPVTAANGPDQANAIDASMEFIVKQRTRIRIQGFVDDETCRALDILGFLDDSFEQKSKVYNAIPSNDTGAEEQLDNAVLNKPCAGAEAIDPGGT